MSFKIFIISMPFFEHLNCLIPIINELVKLKFQVVVYSTKKFQTCIENQNAVFREYRNFNINILNTSANISKTNINIYIQLLIAGLLDICQENLKWIAKDIIREQPNLVLYDTFSLHAKWIMRFLNENQNNPSLISNILDIKLNGKVFLPKSIIYCTFSILSNIYPNTTETDLLLNSEFQSKLYLKLKSSIMMRTIKLSSKFHIKLKQPINEIFVNDGTIMTLVMTYPQLQSKTQIFDLNTGFIRPHFENNINLDNLKYCSNNRVSNVSNSIYSSKNPIYISFEIEFKDEINILLKCIQALEYIALLSNNESKNMKFIISLTSKSFKKLKIFIYRNLIKIPDNIRIEACVSQNDYLKNSSLFITNCGMSGIHEAIHDAVPMLCFPISIFQFIAAHRVASEFELGIMMDTYNSTSEEISDAIIKILTNKSYKERCLKYSELSKLYYGNKNVVNEILNCLNEDKMSGLPSSISILNDDNKKPILSKLS